MYWQLGNELFDHINKISNQNSLILKMKLILRLITLAAIISYFSILALKCYKCTDPEKNVQSSMGHKWLCYSITLFEHLSKKSIGMFTIWVDKEELQNISYGLTELLSSFCSNTENSESWEKIDCAGSCARHRGWVKKKCTNGFKSGGNILGQSASKS